MKNANHTLNHCTLLDEEGNFHFNQSIVINDGILQRITSDVLEGVDCGGLIISPGLVNLHTHAAMSIFKGIAEDVYIDAWFNEEIWPYESKMLDTDVYVGTKLAIAEMLNNGVTAFADHYFSPKAVIQAIEEMKIKGDCAITLFSQFPGYHENLEEAIKLIQSKQVNNVRLRLGPHSPYTCSFEALEEMSDWAKQLNCGLHLHVSETQRQVDDSLELNGKKPLEMTAQSGCLDVPCIIGHGLYITPEEFKLLRDDTMIALSVKTYQKLAMGVGYLWENLDDKHYAIGTDGAASSNTLSPLEQARTLALLIKHEKKDSTQADLKQIWKLLMNGHNALSFNSGKLKVGYAADLVFWDLNRINTLPLYNPLASILYSSDSTNIKAVMIDGEYIKEDYHLKIDEEALISEVHTCVENLLQRGKGKAKVEF
jgi:5-methylthioadenosine/S-adenosylhomocysteine deaminase